MAIRALDLRKGMGVEYKDQIWVVHKQDHVQKGKGQSYMQIELKNVQTGQVIRERFRVDESLPDVYFDRKNMEYLYSDGQHDVLMDTETYEQLELPTDVIGEDRVYLQPNIPVSVSIARGKVVEVELPNTVELTVIDTPPQVKGATVTNQLKDAECEGGARVKVPPFIENGELIKVDTRTGEYLGRA